MKVTTQDYNNITVVELQGEFDCDSFNLFQDAITTVLDKKKKGIVVDAGQLSFVDSKGLETLLWAKDYCTDNHIQLRIAALDENCRKILNVTRLETKFDQYEELTEAVKSFA